MCTPIYRKPSFFTCASNGLIFSYKCNVFLVLCLMWLLCQVWTLDRVTLGRRGTLTEQGVDCFCAVTKQHFFWQEYNEKVFFLVDMEKVCCFYRSMWRIYCSYRYEKNGVLIDMKSMLFPQIFVMYRIGIRVRDLACTGGQSGYHKGHICNLTCN